LKKARTSAEVASRFVVAAEQALEVCADGDMQNMSHSNSHIGGDYLQRLRFSNENPHLRSSYHVFQVRAMPANAKLVTRFAVKR
jgi:hypothetical protein